MGTRAIITKNGKPFIATHWDGYPESLGEDLMNTKTDKEIVEVAKKHNIDFADLRSPSIKAERERRFRNISKKTKGKYSVKKLKEMAKKGEQLRFGIHTPEFSPIDPIKHYDDYAEYQYDLKDGKWRIRELGDTWKKAEKGVWQPLKKAVARAKAKLKKMV